MTMNDGHVLLLTMMFIMMMMMKMLMTIVLIMMMLIMKIPHATYEPLLECCMADSSSPLPTSHIFAFFRWRNRHVGPFEQLLVLQDKRFEFWRHRLDHVGKFAFEPRHRAFFCSWPAASGPCIRVAFR